MRYRFGDAVLDTRSGELTRAGRPVPLEPRAFQLLCALIDREGQLVGHQALVEQVWGDVFVTSHSLTEAISQLRHALGDDSRSPTIIETAHRRGYRFIARLERVPDDDVRPRWRMPAQVVDLLGRDAALRDLVSRLATTRLLTLVGPGGVGKTRLALEAARRVEGTFANGAQLIDLAPAGNHIEVHRLVAAALGVPERQDHELGVSILRDTTALLVLDNCERVAEAAGRVTEAILGAAPGIKVLATSQRPLAASGEVLLHVSPLASTAGTADNGISPAVRLFEVRARAVQPGFQLSEAHACVRQICERLDGLPLAIELAAAQVRVLSPWQILERLDSRFELLSRAGPAGLGRHGTLRSVLEASASLLEPAEAQLLESVSVFQGAWDLNAAAAVMGRPGQSATVLEQLTGIVDKSLAFADTSREFARYRLLDSVRLFALERLGRSERSGIAHDRMLAHYVELTERADREWYAGNSTRWIERLRQERPNLHAAMSWALGRPDRTELGLRLAGNLRWFWRDAGEHIEGYSWLKQALARAPDMATGPLARAEIAFGNFLHSRLNFELAREMIDRGLSRLEDTSPLDSAWGLSMKAQNAALSGRQAECTEAARRALDIAGNLNSEWIAANAHLALGLSHAMDGRHSLAVQEMTGAYDRSVQAANSFLQTYVTVNLALQRLLVGDTIGSREFFVRSLRLSRELQNPRAVAGCFEGLGYLAAVEDDPRLGARLMGAAARIRDITGMPLLPQWRHPQAEHQRIIESRLGRDAAALERAAGAAVPVDDLMPLLT